MCDRVLTDHVLREGQKATFDMFSISCVQAKECSYHVLTVLAINHIVSGGSTFTQGLYFNSILKYFYSTTHLTLSLKANVHLSLIHDIFVTIYKNDDST